MHVSVLSCKYLTSKHKNMNVSLYFLHLVLTFTPITIRSIAEYGSESELYFSFLQVEGSSVSISSSSSSSRTVSVCACVCIVCV